jgi:hypothetical protein
MGFGIYRLLTLKNPRRRHRRQQGAADPQNKRIPWQRFQRSLFLNSATSRFMA